MITKSELVVQDGSTLPVYTAGHPDSPAVVVALACGMPVELSQRWLEFLAPDHFVLTWETRGMFTDLDRPADFDARGTSLADQAGDLIAVLDHYEVPSAHLMGMCGGAVVALWAAAQSDRARSLSLWHGDYSGSRWPTTEHQDNLKALLDMAAQSRADAAAINLALADSTSVDLAPELRELVSYPYQTDELFYRYACLVGPTMTTDTEWLLSTVRQRCLVVTSEDDHTAHPAGSQAVAAELPNASLLVEPHGDHLSVFAAADPLRKALADFLAADDG